MRPQQITYALLSAASDVVTAVGGRIWTGARPQPNDQTDPNGALPALVINVISVTEEPPYNAGPGLTLAQARVQITGVSDDYEALTQIMELVRLALSYQSGIIAGTRVIAILRELVGPDGDDETLGVHSQSCDYIVTYYE